MPGRVKGTRKRTTRALKIALMLAAGNGNSKSREFTRTIRKPNVQSCRDPHHGGAMLFSSKPSFDGEKPMKHDAHWR